jgi:F0F1-type ATP synthase assembly protein I
LTFPGRLPEYAFTDGPRIGLRTPTPEGAKVEERPQQPDQQFRSAARIYQLVSEFVAPIGFGLLIDWGFGTRPWGTLVGVVVGLLVGGLRVAQMARRLAESDRPGGPNPP